MAANAQTFARRVLLLHLTLFIVLVVLVVVASVEIYRRSREQALDQARQRQGMLASQMASGIEGYYRSIFADLNLLKRAEEDESLTPRSLRPAGAPEPTVTPAAGLRFSRILWAQLEGRATELIVVPRRGEMVPNRCLPEDRLPQARAIVRQSRTWLASVEKPSISPFQQLPSGGANLIAIPVGNEILLVAVIPVSAIQHEFLDDVNRHKNLAAWLFDDAGNVVASFTRTLEGKSVTHHMEDPSVRKLADEILQAGKPTSFTIDRPTRMASVVLQPSIIDAHPLDVGDKKWWVVNASTISDVDSVVVATLKRAFIWAGFVIVSMTAVLVSTALGLIRGRARIERMRHELLAKEISQARKIQLAWLPSADHPSDAINIAALNHPANHISGDFYNWFDLPDGRTAVCIGDVTGHGMAAAFLMATTQLLVRNTLPRLLDPGKCLDEVNRQLCVQAFAGQFVTMLLMVIDLKNGTIDLASAGHFAPMVHAPGAQNFAPLPLDPELVLGIETDTQYPTLRHTFKNDLTLLLYTDGVLDAQSPTGQRFGLPRLQSTLAASTATPQSLLQKISDAINRFRATRDLADDLTLVALQLHADAARVRPPQAAGV